MIHLNDAHYTARDMLHSYLELHLMVPYLENWSEDNLRDNPKLLVRLRRLKAFFRAFGIPWDPASFLLGRFLGNEGSRYAPVVQLVTSEMPDVVRKRSKFHKLELAAMFQRLMRYRGNLERALSFNSGVMNASGLPLYTVRKTEEINKVIRPHASVIDDLLVALIDPDAQTFSRNQMVQDFGFPEDDLFKIDIEDW